jgi:hypothetical protein
MSHQIVLPCRPHVRAATARVLAVLALAGLLGGTLDARAASAATSVPKGFEIISVSLIPILKAPPLQLPRRR